MTLFPNFFNDSNSEIASKSMEKFHPLINENQVIQFMTLKKLRTKIKIRNKKIYNKYY